MARWLALGFGIAVTAALWWRALWLPPEWDPTQPLDFRAPRTWVTRWKFERLQTDPDLCVRALATADLRWRRVEGMSGGLCPLPDAVRVIQGDVPTVPSSFLASCRLAVDWFVFLRDVAEPEARSRYGVGLSRVEHLGSYNCRDVREKPGRLSSHARADAIDVTAFVLPDGRRIAVADWRHQGRDTEFLHAVRDRACHVFGIVLSPDFNALHAGHLHLEASPWGMCR